MRSVSDAPAATTPDGARPMVGFTVSLAGAAAALAASAALVASAATFGHALELLLVFVVLTSVQCVAYVAAVQPWLASRTVPAHGQVLQAAVVVLVVATFLGGPELGGVGLCALVAGVLLPHASAIRFRRVNQELEDKDEPWLAEEGAREEATRALSEDPDHARTEQAPAPEE
jgi:hypothetical protein